MGLLEKIFRPATRDRFAKLMEREVRRAGGDREIVYDAATFRLTVGGKDGLKMFLGNAYADYLAASYRGRAQVIRNYAGSAINTLTRVGEDLTYAEARGSLLPRVRERFYHEALCMQSLFEGEEKPLSFPTRPLAEGLTVELVLDHPDSVQILSNTQLEKWGVSFEDALVVAKDNLWKLSNKEFLRHPRGFYISAWQDTHDASRFYLHDLIWQLPVKGDHVAMIPNRNLLLVSGSDDDAALAALAEMADSALQQNRPMTGMAYRLDGNRWVPYLPPPESAAYAPLRLCRLRSHVEQYAEQKNLLEKLHQKTQEDIFIGKSTLVRRTDGSLFTWAVWVDGITDALMPEAELIFFSGVGEDGQPKSIGIASWERVREVAGELMEPTDYYPPRYRVRRFPSAEQIERLELRPEP
jgi:hypothetical protein